MVVRLMNIEYSINDEDVSGRVKKYFGIPEDEDYTDYGILAADWNTKTDEIIDDIVDELPINMNVTVDNVDIDEIAEAALEKVGWPIKFCDYEIVEY